MVLILHIQFLYENLKLILSLQLLFPSIPLNFKEPLYVGTSVIRQLRKVDFPAPILPTTATKSP